MPAMPDDVPPGRAAPEPDTAAELAAMAEAVADADGAREADGPDVDGPEVDGPQVDGPGVDGPEVDALRTRLGEAQERINNLHHALETSRTIGIAMGIVVERGRVTPTQAFDLLVRISQKENRKLRDVAADLVSSGVIPTSASHRG